MRAWFELRHQPNCLLGTGDSQTAVAVDIFSYTGYEIFILIYWVIASKNYRALNMKGSLKVLSGLSSE